MSSFFMVIMAANTLAARSGSPDAISPQFSGTTCQDSPNRSFSQPQGPYWPPSERSASQ